jgi:hypothetical protein
MPCRTISGRSCSRGRDEKKLETHNCVSPAPCLFGAVVAEQLLQGLGVIG